MVKNMLYCVGKGPFVSENTLFRSAIHKNFAVCVIYIESIGLLDYTYPLYTF